MVENDFTKKIWQNKALLCISDESHQFEDLYLSIFRQSYLPLTYPTIQEHFQSLDKIFWFSFNETPVKWHYPIGVLMDIYGANPQLPWKLTLHFTCYPPELLQHPCEDAVRSHFMYCLKESDALKHKSVVINAMQGTDHTQIWQALKEEDFEQFWQINCKLMVGDFKNIPVKFYLPGAKLKQVLIDHEHQTVDATVGEVLERCSLEFESVITQGLNIPLDTPILWMSCNLSYPDNFLHLILR